MFSSSVSSRNVLNSKLTVQHDTAVSVVSLSAEVHSLMQCLLVCQNRLLQAPVLDKQQTVEHRDKLGENASETDKSIKSPDLDIIFICVLEAFLSIFIFLTYGIG